MRVRNVSANKIFIESLTFQSNVPKDLELIELNSTVRQQASQDSLNGPEGLFDDAVCFHQDEVRQYLFYLKPIRPKFRIDNSLQHRLGTVVVAWRNYMGD